MLYVTNAVNCAVPMIRLRYLEIPKYECILIDQTCIRITHTVRNVAVPNLIQENKQFYFGTTVPRIKRYTITRFSCYCAHIFIFSYITIN